MLAPGSRLGPYEIVRLIGAGGMGEVYRARDLRLERDVARKLAIELTPDDRARLEGGRRLDPAAYDEYVKGRYYYNQRSAPDLQRAVEHFRRAIDLDPTYASAYAGLADTYSLIGYQNYLAPQEAFPKASVAARRAIDLDRNLADPHASLGYIHLYYDWDFAKAESEFKRAIESSPNMVPARHFYSILLTALLRPAEARAEIERAHSLDPLSPLVASDKGFELYYAGEYDEAAKALSDDPSEPRFLQTIIGKGYRFVGPVKRITDDAVVARAPSAPSSTECAVVWEGRSIPLADGVNVIGRDSEATVLIDSSTVSRKHAQIVVSGSVATIEDLSSKNATHVNGQRLKGRVRLADYDVIQVGPATLTFRFSSPTGTTLTAGLR